MAEYGCLWIRDVNRSLTDAHPLEQDSVDLRKVDGLRMRGREDLTAADVRLMRGRGSLTAADILQATDREDLTAADARLMRGRGSLTAADILQATDREDLTVADVLWMTEMLHVKKADRRRLRGSESRSAGKKNAGNSSRSADASQLLRSWRDRDS